MRRKMVAGNWKLNTLVQDGENLAKEILKLINEKGKTDATVVIAPPFTHLTTIAAIISESDIHLAAQNCSSEPAGAYTGEVSAAMIRSAGVDHVIIGHSERRSYFNEDDTLLHMKTGLALDNGLTPIFCCGEILEDRNSGAYFDVVRNQIENGLFAFERDIFSKIVIAYEPVWAIGTGVTASPLQAQEMHKYIRSLITDKYGDDTGENCILLYGGSCKSSNAEELFGQPDVDGGLIGGASLTAEDFYQIILAAK